MTVLARPFGAPDFAPTVSEIFEFSFNPTINRQQIYDLATCAFVGRAEALSLIGPGGIGKSHIAQALGRCVLWPMRISMRSSRVATVAVR